MVDDFDDIGFVHWIVKDIPADVQGLEEDASGLSMPEGAEELYNSWREPMYGGLCPPPNSNHTYRFRLYARRVALSTNIKSPWRNPNVTLDVYAQLYDDLLRADNDTLYVAVLPGTFAVGNVSSSKEQRKIVEESPATAPGVWRHIKPSEAYPHKREHYNPRPIDDQFYPQNLSTICRREKPEGMSQKDYAHLCDATPPWAPSPIRSSSTVEAPDKIDRNAPIDVPTTYRPETKNGLPRDPRAIIPKQGIDRTFFDHRRLVDGSCQSHDGSIVPNHYAGPDTGDNKCNMCNCEDFSYMCEQYDCSDPNRAAAVETSRSSVTSASGETTVARAQEIKSATDMAMSPEERAAIEAEEQFNRMVESMAAKQGKTVEEVRESLRSKSQKQAPKEEPKIVWKWGAPPGSATNWNLDNLAAFPDRNVDGPKALVNNNKLVSLLETASFEDDPDGDNMVLAQVGSGDDEIEDDGQGNSAEAAAMMQALQSENSRAKEYVKEHPEFQIDTPETREIAASQEALLANAMAESKREARSFEAHGALTPPGQGIR